MVYELRLHRRRSRVLPWMFLVYHRRQRRTPEQGHERLRARQSGWP